jgi:iron-sulfur cluster assembly accessory protein
MLTLTPTAVEKVKAVMSQRGENGGGLRISVVGGGCSGFQYQMSIDKDSNAEDKIVEQDGIRMFIDPGSLLYLDGTIVDYVETLTGAGFKFDNPNAKGTCGCGESFNA